MDELLYIISIILYVYFAICTLYIAVFTIASFFYRPIKYINNTEYKRYAILIPSYKEDNVIDDSVDSLINQDYDKLHYEVYVISDGMSDITNDRLQSKGINVLKVNFPNSSKAKSLKYACEIINDFDYIIILDADNIVPPSYINDINDFVNTTHCTALQTHRKSKFIINNISYIDSVIEEINNTIFRQGHNAINIPSTLIGSGMIFEHNWFKNNINKVDSVGEDKEIEELLLKQKYYIYYSKEISFKDEKGSNHNNISNQRRRWIATQFYLLNIVLSNIASATRHCNFCYLLKIIETLMLPKSILIGSLLLISIIATFITPYISYIWWLLFFLISGSLFIAIPKYLRDKQLFISFINIPYFIIMMFLNLFKLKDAGKKFIHTQHGGNK